MPMWVWIMIAVGSFLGLSLLVGLVLARILGTIGREIGGLYETEDWTLLPPSRAVKDVKEEEEEEEPDEVAAVPSRIGRLIQRR